MSTFDGEWRSASVARVPINRQIKPPARNATRVFPFLRPRLRRVLRSRRKTGGERLDMAMPTPSAPPTVPVKVLNEGVSSEPAPSPVTIRSGSPIHHWRAPRPTPVLTTRRRQRTSP